MKRFIRYLYEYEGNQKKRNVGFVKVEQDGKETTISVHGCVEKAMKTFPVIL